MRKTALLGGNRDNAANSGSRASNWNNHVWNTNWNIGARFACNRIITALVCLKGHAVRSLTKWLAHFSCVSEYIARFVQGRVAKAKHQDGTAVQYGC